MAGCPTGNFIVSQYLRCEGIRSSHYCFTLRALILQNTEVITDSGSSVSNREQSTLFPGSRFNSGRRADIYRFDVCASHFVALP